MNDIEVKQAALAALTNSSFSALAKVPFSLTAEMLEQFSVYCCQLYSYNQNVNLVADADPDVVVRKHVLDSLSLVEYIQPLMVKRSTTDKKPLSALDIGSGAGFPGLALAIVFPQINFVLVDSVAKKTAFLESIVQELGLGYRVSVVNDRVESLAHEKDFRESFDISTNRALGHLSLLAELSIPCLKQGGWLFCQKTGAQANGEIGQASALIRSLGGGPPTVHVPELKEPDTDRCVISIKKLEQTKAKYPRPWTTMKRELKA